MEQRTEKQVIDIVSEIFTDPPLALEKLFGGHWSTVYRVSLASETVVVKMQFTTNSSLQMEYELMQKLHTYDIGMKIPFPISYGGYQENRGSYFVMSYSEGTSLKKIWPDLPLTERVRLCGQFVETLKNMGDIEVNGYGPLSAKLQGMFPTLKEYIKYQIGKFEEESIKSMFGDKEWNSLVGLLIEYCDTLINPASHLVHADFRLQNMIYSKGEVTLIDFGNALGMLPGFDFYRFCRVDRAEDMLSKSEIDFLNAEYQGEYPYYNQEKPLYQAVLGMQLASFLSNNGNEQLARKYLADIKSAGEEIQDFL